MRLVGRDRKSEVRSEVFHSGHVGEREEAASAWGVRQTTSITPHSTPQGDDPHNAEGGAGKG